MAERGQWSISTLKGREGLISVRGWRCAKYTARSCFSVEVCWVSVSFQTWDKNPKGTIPFSWVCHSAQAIPSGVTDASNSNYSPVWQMPGALICFTNIFTLSKAACCSDPQSYMCSFFTRQYKGWRHWARWGTKVCQTPKSLQRLAPLTHIYLRIGLYLINHSFWDTCLNQPNSSQNLTAVPELWICCGFTIHPVAHKCFSKGWGCPAQVFIY